MCGRKPGILCLVWNSLVSARNESVTGFFLLCAAGEKLFGLVWGLPRLYRVKLCVAAVKTRVPVPRM